MIKIGDTIVDKIIADDKRVKYVRQADNKMIFADIHNSSPFWAPLSLFKNGEPLYIGYKTPGGEYTNPARSYLMVGFDRYSGGGVHLTFRLYDGIHYGATDTPYITIDCEERDTHASFKFFANRTQSKPSVETAFTLYLNGTTYYSLWIVTNPVSDNNIEEFNVAFAVSFDQWSSWNLLYPAMVDGKIQKTRYSSYRAYSSDTNHPIFSTVTISDKGLSVVALYCYLDDRQTTPPIVTQATSDITEMHVLDRDIPIPQLLMPT